MKLTRRNLFKVAGLATGTMVAPGALASADYASAPPIGVLLPAGPAARGLLDGLQQWARTKNIPLAVESITPGSASAVKGAHKLLERNRVKTVIGMVSEAEEVGDALAAHNARLIVANAGANVIRSSQQHSTVTYRTLKLWQANWALGRWAAQHLGKQSVVAMSFYDSGFDAPYAFQLGFEAYGGTVAQTYVTHTPAETVTLDWAIAEIADMQPDFVYASYCGVEAAEFDQAITALQLPVIGTAFLANDPYASFVALGQAVLDEDTPLPTAPLIVRHGNHQRQLSLDELGAIPERDIVQLVTQSSPKTGWVFDYLSM